ncbi:ribokinase [Salinarimonas soli]|uniref:Ribokinase n=1 Tax=Salinarimonas soli TaxID=1638099 RepID=A0A5B2VU03_9HYPH|nr:ribokinase [Salinarimonas soli]KAA2242264.1 ribokinase [Salinarimonas soli]
MSLAHETDLSTEETGSVFILGSFVVACSAKVGRLPRPGESLGAEAFTVEPGGKGLNLAVGVRRLGLAVDGIFAVGDDLFGQVAPAAFARAGLRSSMLRCFPGATGGGVGFTDATGENCLAVHMGANRLLSAACVESAASALRRADLVLAQFEIPDEPVREAFRVARAAGGRTLLNPSPYRPVAPDILALTSVLVLNRVEAAEMAGALGAGDGLEGMARALLERGPDIVAVTLGEEGAVAYRRNAPPVRRPAFPVEAVDTLGAGDAFTAGFASGLVRGLPLEECLVRGAACGALVCRSLGVLDHLPTTAALDAFLARARARA